MPICSKCQRPTKGHPLPWGPMCTMDSNMDGLHQFDPLNDGTESTFLSASPTGAEGGARPKVVVTTSIDHWPPVNMAKLPPARSYIPMTFNDNDTVNTAGTGKDKITDFTAADVLKNFVQEAVPNVHSREMDMVHSCISVLTGQMGKMVLAVESLTKSIQDKDSHTEKHASVSDRAPPPATAPPPNMLTSSHSTTTTYALPTPLSAYQLPTVHSMAQPSAQVLPPHLSTSQQPAGMYMPPSTASASHQSAFPPALPAHLSNAPLSSTTPGASAYSHHPPTAPPGMPHVSAPLQAPHLTAITQNTSMLAGSDYSQVRPASPQWELPMEDVVIGDCVIPREVAVSALQGHYADLSKFVMSPNPACEQDKISISRNGKHLTVTNKLAPKSIHNYQMWTMAWANYEELLMRYLPYTFNIYSKCAEYKRLIHIWQAKYKWPAVFVYDTKFRVNLSKSKSFGFDFFDGRLFSTVFDPTTIRSDAPRCFRCQSIEHHINDCPFQKEPKEEKGKETKKDQICFNFNRNKCTSSECPRRHVCRNCQGPKPASTCGCRAAGGN